MFPKLLGPDGPTTFLRAEQAGFCASLAGGIVVLDTFFRTRFTGFCARECNDVGHRAFSGGDTRTGGADIGAIQAKSNAVLTVLSIRFHFLKAFRHACQTSAATIAAPGAARFAVVFDLSRMTVGRQNSCPEDSDGCGQHFTAFHG